MPTANRTFGMLVAETVYRLSGVWVSCAWKCLPPNGLGERERCVGIQTKLLFCPVGVGVENVSFRSECWIVWLIRDRGKSEVQVVVPSRGLRGMLLVKRTAFPERQCLLAMWVWVERRCLAEKNVLLSRKGFYTMVKSGG
jgi:hypothetical protein